MVMIFIHCRICPFLRFQDKDNFCFPSRHQWRLDNEKEMKPDKGKERKAR